jgi:DNA-binding CsgD family transcriptional regulator
MRTRQAQRRLTSEQIDQLVGDYEAGDSMQNLARIWRLHRTTVADHLRRAGVVVRDRGIPAEKIDEAIRLYSEGCSCQRLAKLYGCNSETVRQALKRAGVSLRSPWERPIRGD